MLQTIQCNVTTPKVVATEVVLPRVTLPTIDLLKLTPRPSSVTYSRNLAHAMHGLDSVFIIDCSSLKDDGLVATGLRKFNRVMNGWHLDGATGSRKKGKLIGTTNPEIKGIIESYFTGSKRISHGSILFSECRKMFSVSALSYVVVPDTEPGCGDCHGYISQSLAIALGIDSKITQYRFGVKDLWVAKGVVAVYPDSMMPAGVDAVFPESSFKGRCPQLFAVQTHNAFFGVMNVAKPLQMASSHQVVHCFNSQPAHDFILGKAREAMTELEEMRAQPSEFAKRMMDNINRSNNNDDDDDDNEEERVSMPVLEILAADKHNQLARHPIVTRTLGSLLRRQLVNIATGKMFNATGLMATPFNTLKPGYAISYSLPTGEYIFWRYPVRHYGDIRLIKVVNPTGIGNRELARYFTGGVTKLNSHDSYRLSNLPGGAFAINPAYFLEVGGDHDGDNACFLPVIGHEPLANEIRFWAELPAIEKPPKLAIQKSLEDIAQASMENGIGMLARLMSACRYWGLTSEFPYLGLQQQLVVDAFKSDTPVDDKYIKKLTFRIMDLEKSQPGNTPWYCQYKSKDLFEAKRLAHDSHPGDIITKLMKFVDTTWGYPESPFQALPPVTFLPLFPTPVQQDTANKVTNYLGEYKADLAALRKLFGDEIPKEEIIVLIQKWTDWAANLRAKLTPEQMNKVVAGFWQATHKQGATYVPSIVLRMFQPEITGAIQEPRVVSQIGFRLWKTLDVECPAGVFMGVVAHDIKFGGLYLWDADTNRRVGKLILDRISKKTNIPAEGHAFPCQVAPNVNAFGETTYYKVGFVVTG